MTGHRKWSEVDESSGGYTLLPSGTRNYTVANAQAIVREYDQKRAVRLQLVSPEGNGSHELTLEPWSGEPQAYEQYESMVRTWLGRLGFVPTGDVTIAQAAEQFAARAASVTGAVVELSVKHEEKTKGEGDDKKTYVNQKVYINDLVRAAPQQEPHPSLAGVGAVGGVYSSDDLPF